METKEKRFEGTVLNGFFMLFVNLLLTLGCPALFIYGLVLIDSDYGSPVPYIVAGLIGSIITIILWCGFMILEPN
jgi:hypothetical protein